MSSAVKEGSKLAISALVAAVCSGILSLDVSEHPISSNFSPFADSLTCCLLKVLIHAQELSHASSASDGNARSGAETERSL